MTNHPTTPGNLTRDQVVDLYFMEHRAKLLDIASFLDRVDRSAATANRDVRLAVLERALAIVNDGKPERARRVLELMSDPSLEPIPRAGGKGAIGVCPAGPNTLEAGPQ